MEDDSGVEGSEDSMDSDESLEQDDDEIVQIPQKVSNVHKQKFKQNLQQHNIKANNKNAFNNKQFQKHFGQSSKKKKLN